MTNIPNRLHHIIKLITNEKKVLDIEKKIGQRVKSSMEKTQKEYYLREQLKAIQKELGDRDGKSGEVEEIRERIDESDLPENIREVALKELGRFEKVPQSSAENSVIRNYLEWLLTLPWTKQTQDTIDIKQAEEVLNEGHYGLDEVKERILEYLAVQKLTNSLKGPILCLVGPPGVGKTSLARSIARSVNRNFVRISLGGVRDEAEIRGHRRTYIGAMPGRIIQGMKKAGTIIQCSYWMKSIRCLMISGEIRLQRCLKSLILNKITVLVITLLKKLMIYPKSCLSLQQIM